MLWEVRGEKSALNLPPKGRQLADPQAYHCILRRAAFVSTPPRPRAPVRCTCILLALMTWEELCPRPGLWHTMPNTSLVSVPSPPATTVETTVGYRDAARINSGKHSLGQVLLKQGLLLSKRLDVSMLLLESNQGEESFWGRSPVLQPEGNSCK